MKSLSLCVPICGAILALFALTPSYAAPYAGVISVPGKIQAENYDTGGQNVSYYDTTTGNTGGQYRSDDVDIEATADTGGGHDVGWTAAGEWLDYTVNVASSGDYSIKVRLASGNVGSFRVKLDGNDLAGVKSFASTGGGQNWTSITVPTRYMSAGQHIFQLYVESGAPNINYIQVISNGADAVSVDLGNPDVNDGVTHLSTCGDGQTIPYTAAGHNGRKNATTNAYYMYFNVSDAWAYQGSKPEVYITFDYYDHGTGSLVVDYDAVGQSYKGAVGATLTNTNTWKSCTVHVYDAYFGNRENCGADFRIDGPGGGAEFAIDAVVVSTVYQAASATAYSSHYGVCDRWWGNYGEGEAEDFLRNLGAKWIRCWFNWEEIETSKGVYDWTLPDAMVASMNAMGVNCYFNFAATPAWARPPGSDNTHPPTNPTDWTDFITVKVNRYKDRVKAWGFWNEPDLDMFWGGTMSQYINDLLVPGINAVKAADPTAQVAVGEMGNSTWLRAMLQAITAAGIKDKVNIICTHMYGFGDTASGRLANQDSLHNLAVAEGFGDKEFWVTETSVAHETYGDQYQADLLIGEMEGMDARPWWKKMFWFTMYELIKPDLTPRVGYTAYQAYIAQHADDAEVVSDTIPATMSAGQQYNVSVTMKNTGTTTWLDNQVYKLGAVGDSDPFAGYRQLMNTGETVAPDETRTFSFVMTAPGAPGTYTTDWQMVREWVRWFGHSLVKQVTVSAGGDTTAPTFGGSISPSVTNSLTPTITITAQDTGSGLNVGSAEFAYSVDGGTSFGTYVGRYALHSKGTGSGGGDQYWYPDFYHPSYTIASGDHLQYDIYSNNTDGKGSIDLEGSFGNLRDSGKVDQNGLNGHPNTNLYSRDYHQWYHRNFDLSSWAGQTITDYEMGHETDAAVSEFYVRNVIITNNGLVKDRAANADAWTAVSDTIFPGNNGYTSTVGPEMITGDPASPAGCTGSNGTTGVQTVSAAFSSTRMMPLVVGNTNRIKFRISDMNANRATSSTFTITIDQTAPTVTINQAFGQADPASASPINFTVLFSESVSDFATGDVTLGGTAGATTATVTGSSTTYNVAVSGMTGNGAVTASLAAGVAHDAAGNGSSASTSSDNTVTYSTCTTPVAPTSASASPSAICSGWSSTLTATGGSGESCKWYAGSCGGTPAGTGTSISVSPTSTTTYYVRWETASCGNSTCATTTVTVGADAALTDARRMDDGQVRALRGNVVTATFTGYFYIQDPLKPFGLRVCSNDSMSVGQEVDVIGAMAGAGTERYIDCADNAVKVTDAGPIAVSPLVVSNAAVGGGDLDSGVPGMVSGAGAYNVGLLVRVCGKVTQTQAGQYFYLDDGCGLKDGTKTSTTDNVGVRIKVSAPTGVVVGKYVVVTGIVSPFNATGLRPQVLPLTEGVTVVGP